MGFVAVGNFDLDAMETRIKDSFSGLKNPDEPRERTQSPLPDHEPKYVVVTDKELTYTSVAVNWKTDDVESNTARGYNESTVEGLAMSILNERFALLTTQPGNAFLGAGIGVQRLTPAEGATYMGIGAPEGKALAAYEAALTEVERLRRFGVTQAELDRARTNHLRQVQSWILESENEPSSEAAEELIRVYTNGEMVTGAEFEAKMVESHVKTLTTEDLNTAFNRLMSEGSKVVVVTQPDKDGAAAPTVEALKAIEAKVSKMELQPPEKEGETEPPVDTPEPGSIVERDTETWSAIGFTKWTLSNGIEVYWKETDFKDDSLTYSGWSPGGTAMVDVADRVAASTAVPLSRQSGAGRLDIPGLVRWGAGKDFTANVGLGGNYESISGSASPKDFESALMATYALITQPRFSEDAFRVERDRRTEGPRNRPRHPRHARTDAWTDARYADEPWQKSWTVPTQPAMHLAQ